MPANHTNTAPAAGAPERKPPPRFSPQQQRVLDFRKVGLTYKETAAVMGISINTVKFHLKEIFKRTGARSSAEAILLAA